MCTLPTIKLIPDSTSPSTATKFRKLQGFDIRVFIKMECTIQRENFIEWNIYLHNSNNSVPIQSYRTILKQSSHLYMAPGRLDYGIYEVQLNINIGAAPSRNTRKSIFIEITRSNLTANLVPYGTSVITSGHQKNLTLNPGKYSIDPDSSVFNASVCIL